MGHVDWQQLAVYGMVLGAVLYLGRTYFGGAKGSGCSSGCGGKCNSGSKSAETQVKSALVQIDLAPPQRNGGKPVG